MSKPTEIGKKYLQLTDNILAEYIYVADRYVNDGIDEDILGFDEGYTGTYGRASDNDSKNTNKYIIAHNDYTGEMYFMNNYESQETTNNTLGNSILPIRKDVTQWVETKAENGNWYVKYDAKWCSNMDNENAEESLLSNPNHTEYIPYDILRIYFQSGYHSEYDGFVINLYSKNKVNKYINLLSVVHHNYDDVQMVTEPMWFADKIYTGYIEYRVPSIAYLSSDCIDGLTMSMSDSNANGWSDYNRSDPKDAPGEQTLPSYITNGKGFYSNPALGIDIHAIVGNTEKHGFNVLKTRTIVSTLFPNKDSYDRLFASIMPASDGDYYKIYGYYEENPNSPIYDDMSLYEYLKKFNGNHNGFTITHILTVTENFTDNTKSKAKTFVHSPITYIQTWDMIKADDYEENPADYNPVIKFRPVLEHADNLTSANINYTLRIISNLDNTSIIKTTSCNIINPRRFGLEMIKAKLNSVNDVHVYNRITQSQSLNVNDVVYPIGAPATTANQASVVVNKYVTSSFIDRRNIRVSISPVRIDNVE